MILVYFVAEIILKMKDRNWILTAEVAERKLKRMALEISEKNPDSEGLVLIGIKGSGTTVAKRIAFHLQDCFYGKVELLEMAINKKEPKDASPDREFEFNNRTVILADDVANSGRTMLYALKPLLKYMPGKIQTLALVERSHKLFPVSIDYVGLSVSTSQGEQIIVEISGDQVRGAYINNK